MNFGTAALATAVTELRAVFGDAAMFVFLADHEAGDVLQEDQRRVALRAQLDEMRPLERALAEEDPVVGQDADRMTVDVREAAHERRSVARLELGEGRAVDDARDDVADVVGLARVGRHDAVDRLARALPAGASGCSGHGS